jgi:D-aspartate ligase
VVLSQGREVRRARLQFNHSTPVLLLCCNTPVGAIGAMRTLGRMGVPVYAMDVEKRGRVWASRYCRRCFRWDPLGAPPEQSLEQLVDAGRRLKRSALLVPTFDEAAIFVATYYDTLKDYFICPRQDPELIRSLVSKKGIYLLARKCGVPVPETIWPQSRKEVLDFIQHVRFPAALKAIRGLRLKLRAGVTAFIVHSADELVQLYDRFEDPTCPNLMIQEYIDGTDRCGWGFNGYFNDRSECVLGGTTRRLHQNPVHVGVTSLSVIEHNEEVDRCARTFMSALGFRGMVNLGFRYDSNDGRYKVLDINPRLGSSFRSFVTRDGSDILRACYLDLTGQNVPQSASTEGRKWLLELDLRSCLVYRKEGQSLHSLLGEYRGVRELAYFSPTDPMPLAALCLLGLWRTLRHGFRLRQPESKAKVSPVMGA